MGSGRSGAAPPCRLSSLPFSAWSLGAGKEISDAAKWVSLLGLPTTPGQCSLSAFLCLSPGRCLF